MAPIRQLSPPPTSPSLKIVPDFSEFNDPWNNYVERETDVIDRVDNDRLDLHNVQFDREPCESNTEETDVFVSFDNRIPSPEPCIEFQYPTALSDAQTNGRLERSCVSNDSVFFL